MKISELINAKPILDEISKRKELPTKVAYSIYLMLSRLDNSLSFFENKKREMFEKYGVAEGEKIVIPNEHMKEFSDALEEVGELDCIDFTDKIDISLDVDLGISPSDFFLLEPLINFIE